MKKSLHKKSPPPETKKGQENFLGALGALGGKSPPPFRPSRQQQQFAYYYITFPHLYDKALRRRNGPAKSDAKRHPESLEGPVSHDSLSQYPTITEIARLIGVHRATIYRWLKDPAFLNWWYYNFSSTVALLAPRFTHALLDSAEFGHPEPLRVFFKMFPPLLPSNPALAETATQFQEDFFPLEPDELSPPLPPPDEPKDPPHRVGEESGEGEFTSNPEPLTPNPVPTHATPCDTQTPQSPPATEES
ncbi:MAG: hypothetical protein ACREJQ_04700 [bacterium]